MASRLIPVILGLALVAAACGGGSSSDSDVATLEVTDSVVVAAGADPSTEPTEPDDEEQLLAFTQCMRDEGVDIGDPTVDADGNLRLGQNIDRTTLDPDATAAAAEVCGEFLEGVTLGFADLDQTEVEDTLLEFANCMRDNDYELDDPDFSNAGAPGPGGNPFGEIDQDDPAFQAAFDACGDLLAGFGRNG